MHFVIGTEFFASGLGSKYAKRLQLRLGHQPLEEVDPELYGVTLMGAQQQAPGDEAFGLGGIYVVGGHCLQTEVSAGGVTHRVIHTWPDKIGQRIDPYMRPALQLVLA